METFKKFNIVKIIYTSSSSVYNLKKISLFKSSDSHRDFYALTKFLCEKIIIKYAKKQQISYLITRLFNVYGGDDNFSIISKIINCYNSKSIFHLNNNGESIRDFIHIDDVTRIYKKIINNEKKNQILDIGKGHGYKIKDIIYELGIKKFNLKYKFLPEEKVSISKLNLSKELNLSEIKKLSLEGYLSAKLKLKNRIKLKKISYDSKLNLNHEISGAIIYGAGNAGKQVCDLILKKNINGVYCFVDDDEKKIGKYYKNKPIISKISLEKISNSTVIPNIIIAIPSLNNEKLQKLFNYLYKLSSTVYNLPLKSEMNIHQINLGDLQKSEFSKIFKRKSFLKKNNNFLKLQNKKILVTGAGGSIGSELVKQLSRITKNKIICLDISEYFLFSLKNNLGINQKKIKLFLGNVNDNYLINKIIKKEKIDLIFHAAAYKHLNFLEENPSQAIMNNIIGTYNLIESSISSSSKKIKMINISTDKAVRPTSILGISKRIAEIICHSYSFKTKSKIEISTVRFGNVFGSMGSVVSLFLEKINNGENVEITNKKAARFFMSINEACNLVIEATQIKKSYKTFILDMGKPVNIFELLKKIVELKKSQDKNFKIKIIETGLKKGEKISEQLSLNNKLIKTSVPGILEVNENKYPIHQVEELINKIKNKNIQNKPNKIIRVLKKFLKKEISKNLN